VNATASDAASAGFDTRVLVDLTAGVAQESTNDALDDMRGKGVLLAYGGR
jgi:nicotinamidase/pyrazinamidase